MSVKGPLLKQRAAEDALWAKATNAVGPSLPHGLHAMSADTEDQLARGHNLAASKAFRMYKVRSEKVRLCPQYNVPMSTHGVIGSYSSEISSSSNARFYLTKAMEQLQLNSWLEMLAFDFVALISTTDFSTICKVLEYC